MLNQELFEKYLTCISPNQTRRINRKVGFRPDFCSLGISFHAMLAGRHPFEDND